MPKKCQITDVVVRSLPEGEWWDSKLPAFGVRVGKRTRTFILKKDNSRISLGKYGEVTLQNARKRALTLKGSPRSSSGPHINLNEAIDLFLHTHCKDYRPASMKQAKHLLGKIRPLDKRLGEISTHDLHNIIDQLPKQSANHTFAMARTFFRFCVRRKLLDKSPLQDQLMPYKRNSRSRVLSNDELKSIWHACPTSSSFERIIRLLILTGQRRGEIAALQGSWIRVDTITFPPTITKNGREHSIPLGALADEILRPALQDGLLFPAVNQPHKPYSYWGKPCGALWKASGVTGVTLHDFRRTYATKMAELGVAPHIIERLLNHVSGSISGVAAIYNRAKYFDEMRAAVDSYEKFLNSIGVGNR